MSEWKNRDPHGLVEHFGWALSSFSFQTLIDLQAGINLGEARGFQPLPYSGRDVVQTLDTQGGSNVTGRYMYRVSGEKPYRGGCTNDTSLSKY